MEGPSASKHPAAFGGDDEQVPLRNAIRVDGEREHEPISEANPNPDRLGLVCIPPNGPMSDYVVDRRS